MTTETSNQILEREPEAFSIWRHYKGGHYMVVCCALDEVTHVQHVVYRSLDTGMAWIRAHDVFFGLTDNGVTRFERIL